MNTREDLGSKTTAERTMADESFWSSNSGTNQQDWAGYLGLDAADDETSAPTEPVTNAEPVELTLAPMVPTVDAPDEYAALTAPNDDLLPRR